MQERGLLLLSRLPMLQSTTNSLSVVPSREIQPDWIAAKSQFFFFFSESRYATIRDCSSWVLPCLVL